MVYVHSLQFVLLTALACLATSATFAQSDLAPLKVTTNIAPSPGFLYLAPNSRVQPRPYQPYMAIYNANGGLVKSGSTANFPFEFKVLPDGRLAYSELIVFAGTSIAAGVYIVDTTLKIVEQLDQKRGYLATQHDFHVLPNGNRVMLGAEDVTLNLSEVVPKGHPAANVVQAVVQEIDVEGNVLVQWKSLDHLPITLSYEDLTAPAIRYIHNNSLWIDDDGNWLLSMRHHSSIVKVNRLTGDVMWILGGKANEFTFIGDHEENAPNYFSYQHDIRRLTNGHITLFDNGTQHSPQYSRAVEYEIDEVNKTCTLVWEYRHAPDIYVGLQGGVQTLTDGHRLIGWGSAANEGAPGVTEVDSTGTVVFEAYYPKQMFVYRATKHPFWPPGRPSATVTVNDVAEGNTYRYASGTKDVGLRIRFTKVSSFFYNTTTARRFMWSPVDPRWLNKNWSTEAPDAKQVRVDVRVDGIREHEMELRFHVDTLGIAAFADTIKVYRRDLPDSLPKPDGGVFKELDTRFDAATRELVVSNTTAGEFAFGIPSAVGSTFGDNRTPKLVYPVGGERVLELSPTTLRVSIPGRADSLHVDVSGDLFDPTPYDFNGKTDSDRIVYTTPGAERMLYWSAFTTLNGTVSWVTNIDSFLVAAAFIEVERPVDNATWTIDSNYVITWQTNISGLVRLELVRPGSAPPILIRDSVRVAARGFLWRLPLDVPSGDDYRVRITSIDGQFANIENTGSAIITVNGVSSVAGVADDAYIVLSPQPASEFFKVETEKSIQSVRVFDMNGEQQLTFVINTSNTFDISTLTSGTYVVVIEDTFRRTYIRTLVVQR